MHSQDLMTVLRERFGFDAFRDGQEEAILAALEGRRVLLIQPTGWGKSLVYQMIAALRGLTLVFSPLRALMRDQVRQACERYALRADTVNSDMDEEEQQAVLERAVNGQIDLLYIAPERLSNPLWQEYQLRLPIRAVVIDEAHCVSVWGHDFRPEYRRIVHLVRLLPPEVPVVAVTATATPRVEQDVREQIGEPFHILRGALTRLNLRLFVQRVNSDAEKLVWLDHLLRLLPGSGLVYTATRGNSEWVAQYLQERGHTVAYYHAGLGAERTALEQQLIRNELKALVCTNALGMGLDKPDLRFVIHAETPASPLHYYQEIGRAGRDGEPSWCILLAHPDDKILQENMIRNSRPAPNAYQQVYTLLQQSPMRERELSLETGLTQNSLRTILYDLMDQGLITRDNERYYRAIRRGQIDHFHYQAILEAKLHDLEAMLAYWETSECRMRYLCRFLGDETARSCGVCDRCQQKGLPPPEPALFAEAERFAYHPPLPLSGVYQKEPVYVQGYALSYYGGTPIGEVVHRCKYESGGALPDWVIQQAATCVRERFPLQQIDALVPIPPSVSGGFVEDFARRLAQRLGVPYMPVLQKTRATRPQKEWTNKVQKAENLKDALLCTQPLNGKRLLVVDDVSDSGVTLEVAGKILKKAGAGALYAFCLARTRHRGDL
ncbi:MAG: RecQ family ATP-dependent DNA helicase [Armatimonadetes bacterium]|nr:RecQ family ATP-dependent DNA helicase [Armatimonadota bacterium]